MKMQKAEFVGILYVSNGNIAHINKISTSGRSFSFDYSKHGNNFVFQCLNHNYQSNIGYYRTYIGWDDYYTTQSRWQFDLRVCGTTWCKRVYDRGYSYFKYAVRALVFAHNKIYFGGARKYGSGLVPYIGHANQDSLSIEWAMNFADRSGSYRYLMIEKLHTDF
jgi:hypothetical protein